MYYINTWPDRFARIQNLLSFVLALINQLYSYFHTPFDEYLQIQLGNRDTVGGGAGGGGGGGRIMSG